MGSICKRRKVSFQFLGSVTKENCTEKGNLRKAEKKRRAWAMKVLGREPSWQEELQALRSQVWTVSLLFEEPRGGQCGWSGVSSYWWNRMHIQRDNESQVMSGLCISMSCFKNLFSDSALTPHTWLHFLSGQELPRLARCCSVVAVSFCAGGS